ncbi:MAG: acyl-CoA/acyl-ACP dehydrogenase [Halomonas sp.]|nr:acyl-CoA dehydrogenase family protein [Halomonas sp.]MCC5900868.1 acyl-CoA/acyl-ACP dehydrogenase [Halomonas sp.]
MKTARQSFPVDTFDKKADIDLLKITRHLSQSAENVDRKACFPNDNFAYLHRMGLLNLTIPAALGGQSADLTTVRQVITAVAKGEASTALILLMHYLQHQQLHHGSAWPEKLRTRVAQDAIQSGALINALRVEPALGSPSRGGLPTTTAYRTTKGWRLSGEKIYSTGSHGLTWMNVWARSDDETPSVGFWLVPAHASGVEIIDEWDHLGMRASSSHRVIFHDVELPLDHAVDNAPLAIANKKAAESEAVKWMHVLLGSLYDGVAQAAYDWFKQWLLTRTPSNLGAPLASLDRFQEIVGRIDTLLLSNKVLLDAAANNDVPLHQLAQIKQITTSQSIRAVEHIVKAAGNPALSGSHPLQRHYRDVLCGRIHTPQDDTVFKAAGQAALNFTGATP